MRVIVATDGSETALGAAREAVTLLRPGAAVELVMVIPAPRDPEADAGGFEGPVVSPEEAAQEWDHDQAAGRDALARTRAVLGEAGEARLVPSEGAPGPALVQIATEEGADVLVLGWSDPGFFRRVFATSVGDHVIHHAPCPVLVVPGG